jgi:serine/threonine protein kinase
MFFMLVGKPPFAEKNRVQKIVSHQVDVTPDIRLLRPKIPERLADIVMRCMEKNPDNRYKNPQELSRDLYIAAEEQGMRPSRFSLSKWYLPSKSRLRVWKDRLAWAIPIVLLIVGVWILNCFWQPDQRQAEFLPESPGLKRSDNSVNANGRPTPIFGAVKKGKVLDFDSDVQSFPPSLEPPAPNGNVTPPTPVAAEDQTPAQSDSAPSAPESIIQPTTVSAKVVQTTQDSTPRQTRSRNSRCRTPVQTAFRLETPCRTIQIKAAPFIP